MFKSYHNIPTILCIKQPPTFIHTALQSKICIGLKAVGWHPSKRISLNESQV